MESGVFEDSNVNKYCILPLKQYKLTILSLVIKHGKITINPFLLLDLLNSLKDIPMSFEDS